MGHLANRNKSDVPAWLRVLSYLIVAWLFAFLYYIPFLKILDFEGDDIYQRILSQVVVVSGFATAYYFFNRYIEGNNYLPKYLKWNARVFLKGLVYGFMLITFCAGLMTLVGVVGFEFHQFYPDLLPYFVLMFLISVGEELAFRGYILNILSSSYGKLWGILGSSFLFGLVHWPNHNSTFVGILTISIFGLLAALLFYRFSSIWLPIGLHLTWNYTQGSILGFAVSGNERTGVFEVIYSNSSGYLTGGEFGMEGSVFLIVMAVTAIGIECRQLRTSVRKDT